MAYEKIWFFGFVMFLCSCFMCVICGVVFKENILLSANRVFYDVVPIFYLSDFLVLRDETMWQFDAEKKLDKNKR